MNQNRKAFLDMIAVSEGTKGLGDDGYNVIIGNSLFFSYRDHPRKIIWVKRIQRYSTAAGRYQILEWIYDHYKAALKLPDFDHESQDRIAVQLIRECHALEDIDAGRFDVAVIKCRSRWASFPGAGYGQGETKLEKLRGAYLDAGGKIA
jgi:muramidase (phage lysozyme)